jgi:two-component system LytT family sensor kinase
VTLLEEVEYLLRYIEMQKVRFGERLQVSVDIPAELLRGQVPPGGSSRAPGPGFS